MQDQRPEFPNLTLLYSQGAALRGLVFSPRVVRRLLGRVHGNGASSTAAVDMARRHDSSSGAGTSGGSRKGSGVMRPSAPQLLLSHPLYVSASQQGSSNLRGARGLGRSGSLARYGLGGRRGQNLAAAWSGAAAAAGGSLGARRSIWG